MMLHSKHWLRFTVSLIAVSLLQVVSVVAEDSLEAAKQTRTTQLRAAEQVLLNAFDEAIVTAAKAKDTEAIKSLIEQKEAFQEQQRRPTLKAVEADFEKYLATRQELNAKLQQQYQQAIATAAVKLQLPLSTALQKEASELAEQEQRVFAKLLAKTVELLPAKKSKTRDQLEEFQTLYQEQLDLIAQTKDEKMTKQLRSDLPEKLNKYLKNRNWSFHCEVKEIKDVSTKTQPDQYAISIAPPEELKGWKSKWKFITAEEVRLKQSDADKVKPGHILVISGYPRFSWGSNRDCFMYTQAPDIYFHYLSFLEFKFNIRKPLPDELPESAK